MELATFGSKAGAPSTEPHQSGLNIVFMTWCVGPSYLCIFLMYKSRNSCHLWYSQKMFLCMRVLLAAYKGDPKNHGIYLLKNCVFILACLNLSHPQSTGLAKKFVQFPCTMALLTLSCLQLHSRQFCEIVLWQLSCQRAFKKTYQEKTSQLLRFFWSWNETQLSPPPKKKIKISEFLV